jgi:hypothetical protein
MHTIHNVLTILALISLCLTIAGLIRPRWVLIRVEGKSRFRALPVFGALCLALAAAASATEPLAMREAGMEKGPVVRGQVPAPVQTESPESSTLSSGGLKAADHKEQAGASEESLVRFLQKNGFRKERSTYLHHPDASHPLRPYVALAYKYDSKGLKSFQLDNWYSDPTAAASIPAAIHSRLESMEAALLTELLGRGLGNRLASIRKDLISSEEGDVFSLTLNGRRLYGLITGGGGSVVFMDDDSPLGKGRYRKTPKRIV